MTTTTETLPVLQSLVGKKATIFKYSEMGFPQSIQCEITEVYEKDYAQYRNLLHVNFRPKGKRCTYIWQIHDYCTFAVFAGHVLLNAEMFVKASTSKSTGLVISESLVCFSSGYLDNALSSTDQKPLLIQRKD